MQTVCSTSSRPLAPSSRRSSAFQAAGAVRTALRCGHRTGRAVACRAELKPGVADTVNVMLKKYDFVSTGMGALCVTGYFWAHGQPPLEALTITAVSTVAALVVNELFFTSGSATKQ